MSLTIKQLAYRTTPDRKQRANYVRILGMKAGYTPQGLGIVVGKTYSKYKIDSRGNVVQNMDPTHYVTTITFIDKQLHVHVSCSCGDNTFRYEVANHYRDAAEIEYSNGEPPTTTNPNMNPGLCKHAYKIFEKIAPKLPNTKAT
jgi:hypothetical protein